MKVSAPNDVKIYNLSAGKFLPEWISARKRRQLSKKDPEIRHRIELIQDFDMPDVSTKIRISADKRSILATGVYKPRLRCYDIHNLAMKFERCMDSEVIDFMILSEDWKKLVFLQEDRFLEFHAQYGIYHKIRIPLFGRSMTYNAATCDLYLVGAYSQIHRLNLELGQFMSPWDLKDSCANCTCLGPSHSLLVTGGGQCGHVEMFDSRSKTRVGLLENPFADLCCDSSNPKAIGAITALTFCDPMMLALGSDLGMIRLFDIRSKRPLLTKDHRNDLPIKDMTYHTPTANIMSLDSKCLKIWNRENGTPFTAIESPVQLNSVCPFPDSGLLFMAQEDRRILSHYIPALGPAPRWCSFLDNLTEELEETESGRLFDDYKFLTAQELCDLGLEHLKGTQLLRAYMHGFFVDERLYKKALNLTRPFALEAFRKQKIQAVVEEERRNRVSKRKREAEDRPKVNAFLALKAKEDASSEEIKQLVEDNRFKSLFTKEEFQIDTSADEYRLLNPLISKLDRKIHKKLASSEKKKPDKVEEEEEAKTSDGGSSDGGSSVDDSSEESSSDDDKGSTAQALRDSHRSVRRGRWQRERARHLEPPSQPSSVIELQETTRDLKNRRKAFGERLSAKEESSSAAKGRATEATFHKVRRKGSDAALQNATEGRRGPPKILVVRSLSEDPPGKWAAERASTTTVKRLLREAKEVKEAEEEDFTAQPLEDNLFEWHFTVRGPVDSDFEGGLYHGRILLPPDYPMKPPSIILLTPNGRFETNKKICLNISGHHPERWQPSWSIRTALLAIIGFMPTQGLGAIGSLDYPPDERKKLARKSQTWSCPTCGPLTGLLPAKRPPLVPQQRAATSDDSSAADKNSSDAAKKEQRDHEISEILKRLDLKAEEPGQQGGAGEGGASSHPPVEATPPPPEATAGDGVRQRATDVPPNPSPPEAQSERPPAAIVTPPADQRRQTAAGATPVPTMAPPRNNSLASYYDLVMNGVVLVLLFLIMRRITIVIDKVYTRFEPSDSPGKCPLMADRLTQLQDAVNAQAENLTNAIGILQQEATPSPFTGFERGASSGKSNSASSGSSEDLAQVFARIISRTAKDIDTLIDSLPSEDLTGELQSESLRVLEDENRGSARQLRESVTRGEQLLARIQAALHDISHSQLSSHRLSSSSTAKAEGGAFDSSAATSSRTPSTSSATATSSASDLAGLATKIKVEQD
ncbi:unnamed protein product [Cyprideis torosa]|uniref:Uncharacterized protein n=1 Tax=Cyprideis torosa TaxID=163714 RepID=A0A7R8W7J4_9CRUS|nr:unnamed protein product [Cyprideis torosa]CAG0887608.1 unnamed protein product [Cyprideis torosa]